MVIYGIYFCGLLALMVSILLAPPLCERIIYLLFRYFSGIAFAVSIRGWAACRKIGSSLSLLAEHPSEQLNG
jgi:hypothetical protein